MTCFIAMAFGKADTDRLYDELICPVLRERAITPVRIDRLEHNENIDDRMMASLREADFVLADLTYARPSVYFEAGFAERQVPVIYTVRRDHLANRADDEFGNFRVHFDLLMRNIIDWTDPNDALFPVRLGRRIDDVLVPLHAKAQETQSKQRAIQDFAQLSFHERKNAIIDRSLQVLETPPISMTASRIPREFGSEDIRVLGTGLRGNGLAFCLVTFLQPGANHAGPTGSDVARCLEVPQTLDYNFGGRLTSIDRLYAHHIVVSLSPISQLDVLQHLADFRCLAESRTLFRKREGFKVPRLSFATKGPVHYPVKGTEVSSTLGGGRSFQGVAVLLSLEYLRSINYSCRLGYLSEWPAERHPGLKVTECSSREIPVTETLHILDSIRSMEELQSALVAALGDAAAVT